MKQGSNGHGLIIVCMSTGGPFSGLTVFGAGSEQVDNVEVRAQVAHDLQL